MKKLIYILVIVLYFLSGTLFAQVTQDWVARYNEPGSTYDLAKSIAADGSGNVYVTGTTSGNGTNEDYTTIKYNSAGVQQWIQRYNGPWNGNDGATSIAVDGSGNVYVTGSSEGIGTNSDYTTIKYNSAGVQQWIQRYNGQINGNDVATSIVIDNSGNVYVTGYSYGSGTGSNYATIKYNSAGVQQWVAIYNGPLNNDDWARSIAIDGLENVYVTGESWGTYYDYATVKYNSSGVEQWAVRYNEPGTYYDYAHSIAVDGSGNVYVTGSVKGVISDYGTIKYNSAGVQQWVAKYNGPGNDIDVAFSLALDDSGNVYVTGQSKGNGTGYDYATIKYNSAGDQKWVQRYNRSQNNDDNARSLVLDGLGNVYVTGESWGFYTDYATIKYNSEGDQKWVQSYNGPGNNHDNATSITVDGSGNVYVTGSSTGNGTGFDYATIKYSQQVGIQNISTEVPSKYSLGQNYPNPFNPMCNVQFSICNTGNVKLVVYDVMGREVRTLVNEKLNAGTYEVKFDGAMLNSGVYFYKLVTERFNETKKMILIK